jgi:hypothetical protein
VLRPGETDSRERGIDRVFHSFHTGWGAISGPHRQAESVCAPGQAPPGEFVSDEHRADCARFLDELKMQIQRRDNRGGDYGWVPARRGLDSG